MTLPLKMLNLMAVTLRRGNADSDAPASRNAGALPDEFPRWSVGTRHILRGISACCLIALEERLSV